MIWGDLKFVGLFLRLQGGYRKYPSVLCLWDSRPDDQHYVSQECLLRKGLKPSLHKVHSHTLVEPDKILQVRSNDEFCEVVEEIEPKRSLIYCIRKKQLKLRGYLRMIWSLEIWTLTGKLEREKQRVTYLICLYKYWTKRN